MDVWAYDLTEDQENLWKNSTDPEIRAEYEQYVKDGLYDPETNKLYEVPEWMADGDLSTGPFDIQLRPSHGTIGF